MKEVIKNKNIKMTRDKKNKKISMIYESVVEIDEDRIDFQIDRLKAIISSLEQQCDSIKAEIEGKKKELELLKNVKKSKILEELNDNHV